MSRFLTDLFTSSEKKQKELIINSFCFHFVGITGLEPATSRPPDVCATNCAKSRTIAVKRLQRYEVKLNNPNSDPSFYLQESFFLHNRMSLWLCCSENTTWHTIKRLTKSQHDGDKIMQTLRDEKRTRQALWTSFHWEVNESKQKWTSLPSLKLTENSIKE